MNLPCGCRTSYIKGLILLLLLKLGGKYMLFDWVHGDPSLPLQQ